MGFSAFRLHWTQGSCYSGEKQVRSNPSPGEQSMHILTRQERDPTPTTSCRRHKSRFQECELLLRLTTAPAFQMNCAAWRWEESGFSSQIPRSNRMYTSCLLLITSCTNATDRFALCSASRLQHVLTGLVYNTQDTLPGHFIRYRRL